MTLQPPPPAWRVVLRQTFRCDVDHLTGLTLRFAGSPGHDAPELADARLRLTLRATDGDPCHREVLVPVAATRPDADHHVYFERVAQGRGRTFELRLSIDDPALAPLVGLRTSAGADRLPGHLHLWSPDPDAPMEAGVVGKLITSNADDVSACPEGLLYSPLSSCNLNCVQCVSSHTRKRAVRLSAAIKEAIDTRVRRGRIRWMFTDYSGDLLFADHKHPGELDFVLALGIAVHIDTNGVYLTQANIDKIVRSKVDAVNISMDAATDATYARIRVGSPPVDTIFSAAGALVAARRAQGRVQDLQIGLGFTLMRSNIEELPLFVRKAAAAGVDAVATRHLEIYSPTMDAETLFDHTDLFNRVRRESLAVAADCGVGLFIGDPLTGRGGGGGDGPCDIPWTSMVVLANGDVQACCSPGSRMGSLHEAGLEEIWRGPAYAELRRRVNTADPPSLCSKCQFRNTLNSFSDGHELRSHRMAKPLLEDLRQG